ncbi:MAG: glycosyltransferase family 2 protein [Desulfobacterales bacterium]|nr:glycosyltransferase family 2 protein [Desulfobacterales bacterium]
MVKKLVSFLQSQERSDEVEIIIQPGEKHSIGYKRNQLIAQATAPYISFIDDDDWVDSRYIPLILEATTTCPDVVGFKGQMTTNGKNPINFIHSLAISSWYTHIRPQKGSVTAYRCPNHLNPVKREIAALCPFKEVSHGEDRDYSFALRGHLHSEVMIEDPPIYFYQYRNKRKHNKRN